LNQIHLTIRSHLKALADLSKVPILLGRLLAALTTLLLIVMPLTEHLCTWDKFLRGGQDFEFGLLGIASLLCLVLVLSQHYKQVINLLLAVRLLVSFALSLEHGSLGITRLGVISEFHRCRADSPACGIYNLPLQI
jgi:hypothetical protein